MSGLLLRNQRIARIAELLAPGVVVPGTSHTVHVKRVAAHPGRMDDKQRREFFTRLPAVAVACSGTSNTDYPEVTGSGRVLPRYVMSVVVFARSEKTATVNITAGDVAQAIAEAIATDVFFNRPDDASTDIDRFVLVNGWESIEDHHDVGMWALEWEEGGEITPTNEDDLPDFITARTEFTIAENGDEPQAIGNVTFEGTDDPDLPEEP